MMRTLLGMVFRMSDMTTLDKATIMVTDNPITMAGFNSTVTANAEQMPSTCTAIGLFLLNGPSKVFFTFSLSFIVIFLLRYQVQLYSKMRYRLQYRFLTSSQRLLM